MGLFRVEIVTPWTEASLGDETAHVPQVAIDFRLARWSDATAQSAANLPPEPNLMVVEGEMEEEELKALRLDERYACLWSEPLVGTSADAEPVDAQAPEKHFDSLRGLLGRSGVEEGKFAEALGAEMGKTRGDVAVRLKNWLKTRPGGGRGA